MDDVLNDERFAHIPRDPAFKRIPKRERKVKIDKRFESMFSDSRFKIKYTVDKRGRPVRNSSSEDLRRFYALDSSNESEDISSDEVDPEGKTELKSKLNKSQIINKEKHEDGTFFQTIDGKSSKLKKKENRGNDSKKSSSPKLDKSNKVQVEVSSEEEVGIEQGDIDSDFDGDGNDKLESHYQSLNEKVRSRLQDMSVDYARGEGVILSDSSSDEESSDDEANEEEEETVAWGQLDQDAGRTDESTYRLALCNMDWDRISAKDLMVLLQSFVPKGGLICSVTIYPSEFGLQRIKEEEEKGPLELRAEGDAIVEESDTGEAEENKKKKIQRDEDEEEEGNEFEREKLRQYQLKRLRYYYAVVVCNNVATADAIYKDCDGIEYESSASRLDLRFIPDDITFDQEPKERCTELPNMDKYEPQYFVTSALQQSKVTLTWDETDPRRSKINEKINAGKVEEVDESDLKAYLATSSEGESSEEEEEAKKESASKYRALLESMETQEVVKKEKNMEMEVSWGIDLKETVDKKLKGGKAEELTPFQKYLERRREKRKAKREEQLKKKQQHRERERESADESKDAIASEDDVPSDIDMNDKYFKEEFEKEEFAHTEKAKSKKKSKKKKGGHESEDEESKRKKAELELLLMDEEDNKKHFSLKDILIEEKQSKKKKKKNKRKLEQESAEKKEDDFQINVQDKRFSALFTSHLYNIDPADPHFKKTKGMETLRQEKLNRRAVDEELPPKKQKIETPEKKKDSELSLLVKNVKRKTQTLKK